MFKKVLVANRGEIATRIIRSCKEMNLKTAAIYSEADSTALHVKKADEAYLVGPGPVAGYLNIHRLVDLAKEIGADAIHPGYGFLSENPRLPELCEKSGITFVGPSSYAISSMGDKSAARKIMTEAGIPVVPGTGNIRSDDEALAFAEKAGFPIMVKATSGGGGRGLRVCRNEKELIDNLKSAKSEAESAFGNAEVFLEKYIENPHHIEFQIMADSQGNIIHLGERDCSIQRRHQKLVEIAPSLLLSEKLRKEMGDVAVRAARAVNYTNAGTIEFILDKEMNYYFIEMNTRLQVEHTVTEAITGISLVRAQLEIAAGMPLAVKQEDVNIRGYAIECRINAEDPKNNFMPYTGKVTAYYSPGGIGVRIDGCVYKDYVIPPYYDSMVAKLIVSGMTWEETVDRMRRSLDEFVVRGIKTTIPFHYNIMTDEEFRKGDFDTGFIDRRPDLLEYSEKRDRTDLVIAISAAIAAYEGF
ncbi:MAG: acetyl-CoA carboxylase biotin carboxylase subunit [Deltaproteobacteria bacterium]|nr:acetyl-CoA carboxylase biotin carboxylase subunit [Deltaproteobacteria bacterium]